ncbi:hypothetical protein Tco_1324756, partial [Tanacetum coccineum]
MATSTTIPLATEWIWSVLLRVVSWWLQRGFRSGDDGSLVVV